VDERCWLRRASHPTHCEATAHPRLRRVSLCTSQRSKRTTFRRARQLQQTPQSPILFERELRGERLEHLALLLEAELTQPQAGGDLGFNCRFRCSRREAHPRATARWQKRSTDRDLLLDTR